MCSPIPFVYACISDVRCKDKTLASCKWGTRRGFLDAASVMVVRSLIVENVLTVRTNPSLMVKERRNRRANIRGVSRYICSFV